MGDKNKPLVNYQIELMDKQEVAVVLNIAERGNSVRHSQYRYPSDFSWNDRSTFGVLKPKRVINAYFLELFWVMCLTEET